MGQPVSERHTAVHAACGLQLELRLGEAVRQLLEVLDARARLAVSLGAAVVLHKAAHLVELRRARLRQLLVEHRLLHIDHGGLSRLSRLRLIRNRDIDLATAARKRAKQVDVARALLLLGGLGGLLLEHTLVVGGHHTHKARK